MPARDRRDYSACFSLKQSVRHNGLEPLNVNAKARLGAMLPLSGPAEAAFLIRRDKTSDLL
jgi:hypothetical protein